MYVNLAEAIVCCLCLGNSMQTEESKWTVQRIHGGDYHNPWAGIPDEHQALFCGI